MPPPDDTVAANVRFSIGWEASRRSNRVGLLQVVQIIPTSASPPGHGSTGKTMTPSKRVEGEPVTPRGRRGLSPPDVRQSCAHAPPPQGGRKRSRHVLAMDNPKCGSAFRQQVLRGEATFTSISGGEGAGGKGSAFGGGCSRVQLSGRVHVAFGDSSEISKVAPVQTCWERTGGPAEPSTATSCRDAQKSLTP